MFLRGDIWRAVAINRLQAPTLLSLRDSRPAKTKASAVHHLARCIPYHVCCYSNSKPSINRSFYKKNPQSLHSCHVPSYKPDRSWYVCRRIFSLFSICNLTILMRHCSISALNPGTDINNWLSLRLFSSDLSYKHCSNFIGSDACNNSSLFSR